MTKKLKPEDMAIPYDLLERLNQAIDIFPDRDAAAAALGISKSQLFKLIRGENMPKFGTVKKLAAETQISLDWLAFGSHAQTLKTEQGLSPSFVEPYLCPGSPGEEQNEPSVQLQPILITDDTMAPTIVPGDWVGIAPLTSLRNGLFLVDSLAGPRVRRLQCCADHVLVCCDNPLYQNETREYKHSHGVLAEVHWVHRRHKPHGESTGF